MAIRVTIAGVDKSSVIDWTSLEVEQQVTSQVDSATFRIRVHAGKTYVPDVGDTVIIEEETGLLLTEDGDELMTEDGESIALDGGDVNKIFGGTIVRIDNEIDAVMGFFTITCVSHERTLDRYLVVREIEDEPARYVLNTIMAEFVNRITKVIDSGESNEVWTTEDGTVAATTTQGEYVLGSQARKFTATAGSTATARRESALVLSTFDDGTLFNSDDYVKLWIDVDDIDNLASVRLRMVTDTLATYTNYYEYTISASELTTGWNEIVIAKSAFTTVGSPSWANIQKRQYRITATGSGTAIVNIDDVRLVDADTYFSQTGVQDADTVIGSVKFNYEQASGAIKQVAEAVGNDWYIDPDRDLNFYAPASVPAPFSLSDTSANFVWNSLKTTQDLTTIRNSVFVRGGEYEGPVSDFEQVADGVALNYRSPYKIKNLTVEVDAVPKTVGVDNLDDPASFDCLYNFLEKNLKFKPSTLPSAGQTVTMTGNPIVPVIVKRGDPVSIADHGTFEYLVIDRSINTLQGARDRAAAELRNYRNALIEGGFRTDTPGLRAGQSIVIMVTSRNIAETFVIQSIRFRTKSPTSFQYDVTLVSTRVFGIIEYLLAALRDDRKQITINDNESIDLVQDISESIAVADAWTTNENLEQATEAIELGETTDSQLNHGTIFVLTPYTPSGFADTKRPFILDGSPLG